jgi:streptomycin 6-kinase
MQGMTHNIQSYAEKWGLVLEREIQTASGTVWLARQGDLPVVLKLPHPNSDETRQKDVLQHFHGNGAVRVIASDGAALLLERLTPGHHVVELTKDGQDDEATRIFCRVARQLHAAQGPLDSFTPIGELALAFDRYSDSGDTRISAQQVREARDLFLSLTASQGAPVLLHGDLHHDNIVEDAARLGRHRSQRLCGRAALRGGRLAAQSECSIRGCAPDY